MKKMESRNPKIVCMCGRQIDADYNNHSYEAPGESACECGRIWNLKFLGWSDCNILEPTI